MGVNTIPNCCCCGPCEVNPGACCACICNTLCVTWEAYGENPTSVEADWDSVNKWFSGSVGGIDFIIYPERGEYGDCYLKVRSDAMDYPEGYEAELLFGYDVACADLAGSVESADDYSVGTLTFACVEKITPTECTGCRCLPECLCIEVRRYIDYEQCASCSGKLCWVDYDHSYAGAALRCSSDLEISAEVLVRQKGDYCEDTYPGSTEYDDCDPYDETCIAVLNIPALDLIDEWVELPPNCDDDFTVSWVIERETYEGTERIEVDVRPAICNEDCIVRSVCECCQKGQDFIQSPNATLVVTILNPNNDCDGGTIVAESSPNWSCGIHDPSIGLGTNLDGELYCENGEWKFRLTGGFGTEGASDTVYGTITTAICPECPGDEYGNTEGYFLIENMQLPCSTSGGAEPAVQLQAEVFIEAVCPCVPA